MTTYTNTHTQSKAASSMSIVALLIAVISLVIAVMAYNRSGTDIEDQVPVTSEQIENRLAYEQRMIESRVRLWGLQSEIAVNENTDETVNDIQNIRADVQEAYQYTENETQDEVREVERQFDQLEQQVREGSADALGTLERLIELLRKDVSSDVENSENSALDTLEKGTVSVRTGL
jgi:hypothetical protein